MNRRELFGKVVAVLAGFGLMPIVAKANAPLPTFGAVDMDRWFYLKAHGFYTRVFHHGQEVDGVFFFDDELDYCERFKTNAKGQRYIDRGSWKPASEVIHGIEIRVENRQT